MRGSICRRLARRRWARRASRSTGRGWPTCSASTRRSENSYDANQISPIDGGAEIAGLATSGALTIGALIADVTAQYAQTEPWILLAEGEQTGISSIMPQKRNPSGLVRLRAEASNLIGEAATFALIAHNVAAGHERLQGFRQSEGISQRACCATWPRCSRMPRP